MNCNLKIKVKNKRTKEELILTLAEFKEKFSNEIEFAIQSFTKNEKSKKLYLQFVNPNKDYEEDFYFDLQWNFNSFVNSVWYIEKFV